MTGELGGLVEVMLRWRLVEVEGVVAVAEVAARERGVLSRKVWGKGVVVVWVLVECAVGVCARG